jgi:hypothetical protein
MKKLMLITMVISLLICTDVFAATVILPWTPINDINVTKVNVYSTSVPGCVTLVPKTPTIPPWKFVTSVPASESVTAINPGGTVAGETVCFYITSVANATGESQPSEVMVVKIPSPVPVPRSPIVK